MKKITLLPLTLTMMTLCVCSSHAEEKHAPLKVGMIAPLSGTGADYGIAARSGFEMALHDRKAAHEISVVYEDDQYTPAKTVIAFKKLKDVNGAQVMLCLGSTSCNAIAPLAENAKIPLIAWAGDTKVSRGRKYIFRAGQSAQSDGKKMAEEALRRGYASFAVLTATGDFQSSIRKGLQKGLPAEALLMDEEVPADTKDFRPLLLRAKQLGVETFALCMHPGQHGLLAKHSRQLQMKPAFFGCDTIQDSEEIKISSGALYGAWYIGQFVEDSFHELYLQRQGNDSVLAGAAIFYEIASLLIDITQRESNLPLREKILHSGKRKSVVGAYMIRAVHGDQFFDIPQVVVEMNKPS